ncbi:MAG: NFACT family protein, partial [Lachnospiraceae bacterium]|nr:NFACT family protein [Lachnospiraceae bacterium]
SSVRTVLPGRDYFIPETQGKRDVFSETESTFRASLKAGDTLSEAVSAHYTGFSTQAVSEFLFENGFAPETFVSALDEAGTARFCSAFFRYLDDIRNGRFRPAAAYENGTPVSFNAMGLPSYETNPSLYRVVSFDSPSALLSTYYRERNASTNMKQRSADLKRAASTLLERAVKKEALQKKQLKDAGKRDQYRLYGELLNAYSYSLPVGEKTVTVLNYYDNTELTIPVDPDLSIKDNAKRFFDRYAKQKRTADALTGQLQETEAEIAHLSSVVQAIDMAQDTETLSQIREEMEEAGYLKRPAGKGRAKAQTRSKPWHYRSSDGFDIYVGKNNLQNDELTFRTAGPRDLWFHAKHMPGSHVILKTDGAEVPDRAYEEAAALAAYYSSGRNSAKCDVDYVEKKEVKKPAGAKPGFVVYYTNYSMTVAPSKDRVTLVE